MLRHDACGLLPWFDPVTLELQEDEISLDYEKSTVEAIARVFGAIDYVRSKECLLRVMVPLPGAKTR